MTVLLKVDKKAQSCSPSLREYFLPLINGIKNKGTYAASVRASVTRQVIEEWQLYSAYHF